MSARYRTGSHWGRTLIREGSQPADVSGRRPDDQLVGVIDNPGLAERICVLLNADEQDHEQDALTVGWHVEDCQCLVSDGAVLNVDLRCDIP